MASSLLVSTIYMAAKKMGARKPVLLKMLNMMESSLRHPDGRFDLSAITAIAASTIVETETKDFPQAFANAMQPRGFSDLGYSARFANTIGDVLQDIIAVMQWDPHNTPLRIERDRKSARIIWTGGYVYSPETAAIILHFIAQNLNDLLPDNRVYSANNQFDRTDAVRFKRSIFTDIDFYHGEGAVSQNLPLFAVNERNDGIDFPVKLLNQPSRHANRDLHSAAKKQVGITGETHRHKKPVTEMTYRYLMPLLDKCGLNLAAAAKSFGLAERTMRRWLAAEGTCFRDVLEQVRRDTCELYFRENTRSLSGIASCLGYSELSAFTRAYTAWHGCAPSKDYASIRDNLERV